MTTFYAALLQNSMTKAETLRQSQIALITGNFEALEDETRGIVELRQRIQESVPTVAPHLDHPYYWHPSSSLAMAYEATLKALFETSSSLQMEEWYFHFYQRLNEEKLKICKMHDYSHS